MDKEEQLLAREWAEGVNLDYDTKECLAARKFILENVPERTMEDIEWSKEEHHLRIAKILSSDSTVLMLSPSVGLDHIWCLSKKGYVYKIRLDELVPGNKKYSLWSDREDLDFLKSVEDYRNAPIGTVVATDTGDPWIKNSRGYWEGISFVEDSKKMSEGVSRRVLRWGWRE
ncbi:hypothetical protein LA324_05255 [Corynebacterium coyleae]|uniref:hypothetical protein n=1 Tax=Corynebacterium coyleae TaxID=53374 RepID=UPI001CCA696A|nr:hypothetical protein [Corynebacterium coyleae]UBI10018.1 hypothetical protein LA324_05255 [Corynebacterium coyleae]